jgi:lipopolysaccharide transport system ATP-binding protein
MTVISVEQVSKAYRLGQIGGGTLREDFSRWCARLRGKPDPFLKIGQEHLARRMGEQFWALNNVSFEVKQGEVLGIIGRNGAGKSTLLKILSQVTTPTSGQIKIKGRIASLLEVGTGFHPELTGRENVFLNGAILGMTKAEIRKKFDEIVAFSEIEEFIDTPVKRYSSGMYVRLAFAVAAHLEPEILIVDEVLAVGDAEFQKKCLGKMQDVATNQGRTVLFVSHNLGAVKALCSTAMELFGGRLRQRGLPSVVAERYMASESTKLKHLVWARDEAKGNEEFRLLSLRVFQRGIESENMLISDKEIIVEIQFWNCIEDKDLCVGFELLSPDGLTLFWSYQTDQPIDRWPTIRKGKNSFLCRIPPGILNGGTYFLAPKISLHNRRWIFNGEPLLSFDVRLNHGVSPFWTALSNGSRPGIFTPILSWEQSDGT